MRSLVKVLVVPAIFGLTACQACSEKTKQSTPAETNSLSTATSDFTSTQSSPSTASEIAATSGAAESSSATTTLSSTATGANTAAPSSELPVGLNINDVKSGSGASAESGKKITVHYVGTLKDGSKFDSSRDHGEPFSFVLGAGTVIPGWDFGLKGMRVGGVRKLEIAPELAYGRQAVGDVIPPNSTLLFEIELLKVE